MIRFASTSSQLLILYCEHLLIIATRYWTTGRPTEISCLIARLYFHGRTSTLAYSVLTYKMLRNNKIVIILYMKHLRHTRTCMRQKSE